MQSYQMGFFDQGQEGTERDWPGKQSRQKKFYRSRVDQSGKMLPGTKQRKKPTHHLLARFLLALFSTLVFLLVAGGILINSQAGVSDFTTVDLLLALVSYVGVNVIVNLLLDRALKEIDRRKPVTRRVIFALASFLLAPIFCEMMIQGYNGIDGVLLIIVSVVVANSISYLTLCKKRSLLEQSSTFRTARS